MAESINCQYTLREWAPLTDLFSKLPNKIQSGLFHHDIKLTCVNVLLEFVALGTNVGVVYWYDRKKRDMQQLRCQVIRRVYKLNLKRNKFICVEFQFTDTCYQSNIHCGLYAGLWQRRRFNKYISNTQITPREFTRNA